GEGIFKSVGTVDVLAHELPETAQSTSGIAHTRWATHGLPTKGNAHPHHGPERRVWLVHNGIIENYKELKRDLQDEGDAFVSETDSEVLAYLIEGELAHADSLEEAVTRALQMVRGTFGIAVMDAAEPETIIAARMGSPIALGLGNEENLVASDASAIVRHTKHVVYLNDGEYAVVRPDSFQVFTLDHKKQDPAQYVIEWDIEDVKKQGYPHFMLKEIMEGPEVIRNTLRGRLNPAEGDVKLGGIESVAEELREVERLVIVACGTAYYAGLYGKYLIEELSGIHVDVEIASEFRYQNTNLSGKTAVLAVTQSGETADTLACIKEAKKNGTLTLGIVNVVGSTIARESDAGIYNHAGPEIGVASTKAYLSQLAVFVLLGLYFGRRRGLSQAEGLRLINDLARIPDHLETVLAQSEAIKALAREYADHRDFLFIGRKGNFGTAYEGALKLKEISYLHAEGYGAGEMKHGPIAMIDESFPTFAIAPQDSVYEKTVSNVEEIKARKGPVVAVVTAGDQELSALADHVIEIPAVTEELAPILAVVPTHLFAYHLGVARDYNVDRPRNLAKSVTVE
ncbi:glutamine--fructose-6-phosphate transaminase (isomerizing), partial [Patescibacteria group bacterium]|nr:glutamine--fructose-6-phosphate transaminase (isomerizing) [Patescibacteria group bacterium]